jgi:dTDP-4-dehydrorhamnose 3,5-epimerase-like enzyme
MYEIQELNLLSTNNNGSTYELAAIKSEGYLLATRSAGTTSGNHWHNGQPVAKNPESLLLIKGSVKLSLKHIKTEEQVQLKIVAPKMIKIMPQVLHKLEAITDIIFLEFNSLEEHKADTFYPSKLI